MSSGGWEADGHRGAAGVGAGALVQPKAQLPAQLVPVPGAPSWSCGEELANLWARDAVLQHQRQAAGAKGTEPELLTPERSQRRELEALPADTNTVTENVGTTVTDLPGAWH